MVIFGCVCMCGLSQCTHGMPEDARNPNAQSDTEHSILKFVKTLATGMYIYLHTMNSDKHWYTLVQQGNLRHCTIL